MSTRATEAHFHACQGEVAHDVQVHGQRAQQGVHGKSGSTGSAGFAQVLGEQVAKSSPKVENVEKTGGRFMPKDTVVPPPATSQTPHADTHSLPVAAPSRQATNHSSQAAAHSPQATAQSSQTAAHSPQATAQSSQTAARPARATAQSSRAPSTVAENQTNTRASAQVRLERIEHTPSDLSRAIPEGPQPEGNAEPGEPAASGLTPQLRTEKSGPKADAEQTAGSTTTRWNTDKAPTSPSHPSGAKPSVAWQTVETTTRHGAPMPAERAGHLESPVRLDHFPAHASIAAPAAIPQHVSGIPLFAHKASERSESSVQPETPGSTKEHVAVAPSAVVAHDDGAPTNTQGTTRVPRLAQAMSLPTHAAKEQVEDKRRQPIQPQTTAASAREPARVPEIAIAQTPVPSHIPSSVPVPERVPADASPTNHDPPGTATARSPNAKSDRVSMATRAGKSPAPAFARTDEAARRPSPKASEPAAEPSSKAGPDATPSPSPFLATAVAAKSIASERTPHAEHSTTRSAPVSREGHPTVKAGLADNAHSDHAPTRTNPSSSLASPSRHAKAKLEGVTAQVSHVSTPATAPAERQVHAEPASEATAEPAQGESLTLPSPHPARESKGQTSSAQVAEVPQVVGPKVQHPSLAPAPPPVLPSQVSLDLKSAATPGTIRTASSNSATEKPEKPLTARPASGEARIRQDSESGDSHGERVSSEPAESQPEISAKKPIRTATDQSESATGEHQPTSPAPASGKAGNRGTNQAEAAPSKRTTNADKEDQPASAAKAPTAPSPAFTVPTSSSPTAAAQAKSPKQETHQPPEGKDSTDHSPAINGTEATTRQAHTLKPDIGSVILPPSDHPHAVAPINTVLPGSSEMSFREVSSPSAFVAERAGLMNRVIDDPGLSVNVMPHAAHLSISGTAGDLSLHVRVRDGSADINVSGSMAPLFDAKGPEVRTVLASEGLSLGSYATDQQGSSQGQQGQPESAPTAADLQPAPAPRRASTSIPEVQIADDHRIHVTA